MIFNHLLAKDGRLLVNRLYLRKILRSPEGRVRSLTFDDLGSLFPFLHVSRLVLGAEFEFSNHLNIY